MDGAGVSALPRAARNILGAGTLCYLAAPSRSGPHVTPVVFVLDGDRIWGTTGRRTTKARRWRREPAAGGLVRLEERAVAFRGPVTTYDALDPRTWPDSLMRGPAVARASARFVLKNARFFAGYARDAYRVPLGWTPPGRVIFSIELEAGVVLEADRVVDRWGRWGSRVISRASFRATHGDPLSGIPRGLGSLQRTKGDGTLGIDGPRGPYVVPAVWTRPDDCYYAVVPRPILSLAGAPRDPLTGLVVDRASSWRAANMQGLLLRGETALFVPGKVTSGRDELLSRVAALGDLPSDPAIVRIRPRTAVWWRGWASGTVRRR